MQNTRQAVLFFQHLNYVPLSYYLYTFWWEIYCLLNCHFSQVIHSFILFSFKIFVFNYQKFIRNLSKPRHRFLWYYPVSVCSTCWICKVYILLCFSPKYFFFNFFLLWCHNFFSSFFELWWIIPLSGLLLLSHNSLQINLCFFNVFS